MYFGRPQHELEGSHKLVVTGVPALGNKLSVYHFPVEYCVVTETSNCENVCFPVYSWDTTTRKISQSI